MSMNTVSWRQVKTSEGKTTLVPAGRNRSGRDCIFRVLLPGVFVVMAFYRIFVVTPETGEFYTNLAAKLMTRMYIKGNPAPFPSSQQSVSNTLQRTSIDPVQPGSLI